MSVIWKRLRRDYGEAREGVSAGWVALPEAAPFPHWPKQARNGLGKDTLRHLARHVG
jgi:hypothetical protein